MDNHAEILNIRHFGPIEMADITFYKYTILIGEQGSGKSTVAKLYALFTWMEKAITRHQLTIKYITQYSRFRNNYCAFNNMNSYFNENTYLHFVGSHYEFIYGEGRLTISELNAEVNHFNIAKVMYVPAERNVIGSVAHPTRLKGLPDAMNTFLEEYDIARTKIKSGYKLPFNEVVFEYDKLNDVSWIKTEQYKIKLSEASSGYQSTLPLLLVSRNLSNMVFDKYKQTSLGDKEQKALQRDVDRIMHDESLTEDVRMAFLRSISSKFRYSRFVNIVEEMELNLYPSSQRSVLYELFANNSRLSANQLLLTTHSPYILSYTTLAVKAYQLAERCKDNDEILQRIYEVVPKNSIVDHRLLRVYELRDGHLSQLSDYHGIPSDDNFLNNSLEETNTNYDALLEIEEDLNRM
jgi:predicted ATPase